MHRNFIIESKTQKNKKVVNLYFEDFQVTYRILQEVPESELTGNEIIEDSSLLLSPFDLLKVEDFHGKFFLHNEKIHQCIYAKTCVLDQNIWKPYKELYIVLTDEVGHRDSLCFIDRYAETFLSKMNHNTFNKRNKVFGGYTAAKFIVLPNTTLLTAPAYFSTDFDIITNIEFDSRFDYEIAVHKPEIVNDWKDYYLPKVNIAGPSEIPANGFTKLNIFITHEGGKKCLDNHTYYAECIQGYAPNKEINVIEGEATFKVSALGLEPGEKMRVKVNDKLWTNKAEITLNVV